MEGGGLLKFFASSRGGGSDNVAPPAGGGQFSPPRAKIPAPLPLDVNSVISLMFSNLAEKVYSRLLCISQAMQWSDHFLTVMYIPL